MLPAIYEGQENYIFISYAHKDSTKVLPIVSRLAEEGFRVWYDEGIEAGNEWPECIATHLAAAEVVLLFLSAHALNSQNCTREIHYAISKRKKLLAVHLEELTLTPGMEMQLGVVQALYMHEMKGEDFFDRLLRTSLLSSCRPSASLSSEVKAPSAAEPCPRPHAHPNDTKTAPFSSIGLSFEENEDGTATVTGVGRCEDQTVYIPPFSPNGNTVTKIGERAFFGCRHLKAIFLPEGLTRIEKFAFSHCKGLASIHLPASLSDIDEGFLRGCKLLKTISAAAGSSYEVREGALIRCHDQTLLKTIRNGKIPDGVRTLAPFSVVYDSWNNREPILLPASVEHVMPRSFAEAGFSSIDTSKNNRFLFNRGCLIDREARRLILGRAESVLPADTGYTSIGEYAFAEQKSIFNLKIPEGVRAIEKGAFFELENLETVILPNTLERIAPYAFANCVSLRLIRLPDRLTHIGENAFLGCTSLTAVFMKEQQKWQTDDKPVAPLSEKELAKVFQSRSHTWKKNN